MDGICREHHQEVLQKDDNHIQLKWLMQAYRLFPDKKIFIVKSALWL